jgi:IclR family transcriptional regulator, KDG regulon repressor
MARDIRFTTRTPAVEQAAEILRYLASDSKIRANLTHITEAVKINKSKTHVLLNALEKCGFVMRDPADKSYSLGFSLIPIGLMALENADYAAASKPVLNELAKKTHCSALFGLIAGENLVIAEVEQSGQILQSRMKPGHTFDLFYGAHGKVIMASLPEDEQKRMIETRNVAFDPGLKEKKTYEELINDLKICRRNGYAHRFLGPSDEVNLLASAVLAADGRPVGALLIVGLFKKSVIKKYGRMVAESARHFSSLLGAPENASIDKDRKVSECGIRRLQKPKSI